MKPIPFFSFPRREVERIAPLSSSFLSNWEAARPGVLDDNSIDVFLPNSRTEKQGKNTAYELFERVETVKPDTMIVVMSWLELQLADGQRHGIARLIDAVRSKYPNNPVVYSWNHDENEANIDELQCLLPNEFCLAYNTSKPSSQDILVPFWNIETRQIWNPNDDRTERFGFIGYVGGVGVRQKMYAAFSGKPGCHVSATERMGRMEHGEYIRTMLNWDFALCPRGGGLSSYRLYEAIQCGCVPILFADDAALPYPDLDWNNIVMRMPEHWAENFGLVTKLADKIDVKNRRKRIAEVRERLTLAGVQREIAKRIGEYLK